MLGFKFIKVEPTTYLIKYRNGKVTKEGAGISFFYHAPTTSLVSIPIASEDMYFMFSELTEDFQEVTVQGLVTCKVVNVHSLTKMLNYTIIPSGEYVSDDPNRLSKMIINLVQVAMRKELSQLTLKNAIFSAESIAEKIKISLAESHELLTLGVEVIELSIVAIKPTQETARALEAEARETLLQKADEAIYLRRNSAIEQERIIKENELKTEIAIEQKKREIKEKKLEIERMEQEKRREMQEAKLSGEILLQKKNEELVSLVAANSMKEADAKSYAIKANLAAIDNTDPQVIQSLVMTGMSPHQLIAASFKELAMNASKIGQLNISPDLLNQLIRPAHE